MAVYTTKYTGGNAALDAELKKQSEIYAEARKKALSGDQNAVTTMRNANDAANRMRNQHGYAAEYANDDIENVKSQIGYTGSTGSSQKSSSKSSTGSSAGGSTGSDMSNYLQEMYAAQRKAALAKLNSAYQSSVNAIDRAGAGLDTEYQNAKNKAAGQSARSARNFQEYAAATGLNKGAGGQAELARTVSLQNDLNALEAQKASAVADIALQKANAETEYTGAVAEAEAQGNYELASALYEEKIRQQEAALQQQMLAYQVQRDAVADNQWQQQFDYETGSAAKNQLAEYGSAFLTKGIMPSAEMLAAMNMTAEDAQRYISGLSLAKSVKAAAGNSTTEKPALTYSQVMDAIENGNLTPNVLSGYKYYMGSDYPSQNTMSNADFSDFVRNIPRQSAAVTQAAIDKYWGSMTEAQKGTVNNLLKQMGYMVKE